MLADGLTKPLNGSKMDFFTKGLGLRTYTSGSVEECDVTVSNDGVCVTPQD